MSQGARIQLQVTRRPAAEVISELQQEVAHWRGRALKAEARVAELLRENEDRKSVV